MNFPIKNQKQGAIGRLHLGRIRFWTVIYRKQFTKNPAIRRYCRIFVTSVYDKIPRSKLLCTIKDKSLDAEQITNSSESWRISSCFNAVMRQRIVFYGDLSLSEVALMGGFFYILQWKKASVFVENSLLYDYDVLKCY